VRRALDESSYTIRFTPRKPKSIWSNVKVSRVEAMIKEGLTASMGMKAFEARSHKRSGIYAFENKQQELDPAYEKKFRSRKKAWQFFQTQAPWYRRTAIYWVMSAKKEETREKR